MVYDFIVIGGGIIGSSVAMQLSKKFKDSKIAIMEKEKSLAMHQSGHNSGVIHAGVYYSPGSLKAKFCTQGNAAIREFCDENGLRYEMCGKLIVATTNAELERMEGIWNKSGENGLERSRLDAKELRELEPNISGLGGIFFPSSGITDYAKITATMVDRFKENGGEVYLNTEVIDIIEHSNGVVIRTLSNKVKKKFECKYLISCAGLMSDKIVKMLDIEPDFVICPFRGEYYKLSENRNNIVNHLIYPVPEPGVPFLGVHLTKSINGGITVGPNAVLALKREGYKKYHISLKDMCEMIGHGGIRKVIAKNLKVGLSEFKNSFYKEGYVKQVQKYCPMLTKKDLLSYPAGVRAQAISNSGEMIEDFLFVNTEHCVIVCNAPSPAATSSIPIGAHIIQTMEDMIQSREASMFIKE